MKNRMLSLCIFLFLLSCQKVEENSTQNESAVQLNLDDPADNLLAFMKVRGSLDENEEVIFYASGRMYGQVEGERDQPLMDFEMFNIAKTVKTGDHSYDLLTREAGIYKSIETGEPLESWDNPYTGEAVDVLHLWNDPVNQKLELDGRFGKWNVPYQRVSSGRICMNLDIFLHYPSALSVAEFPENSQSDTYEAAELYQFYFSENDVHDPSKNSVESDVAWTRIGPWLPWMKMGQRPGKLVYHCTGYKLSGNDFEKMPASLREYVLSRKPEYRHAPSEFTKPNETSWTYFKKLKN